MPDFPFFFGHILGTYKGDKSENTRKWDRLELENLKLSESNSFLKDMLQGLSQEKLSLTKKLTSYESQIKDLTGLLEAKSRDNETLKEENEKNAKKSKKLEEMLKMSNFSFFNISKKNESLEKENSCLGTELTSLQKARDRLSMKWQLASGTGKGTRGDNFL